MKKPYLFINVSFSFWFLTLIAWILNYPTGALFFFILSILFLTLYFNKKRINKMFTRKQNKPIMENKSSISELEIIPKFEEQTISSTPTVNEDKTNTVISRDVVFEGNITSNEQILIYGKVIGNITGKDNTVKVMLNGQVIGNITSKELIVNGKIEGECLSEIISIENNGEVHGTITYSNLAIKKGGILSGQAKVRNITAKNEKVTILKDVIKHGIPTNDIDKNKDTTSI